MVRNARSGVGDPLGVVDPRRVKRELSKNAGGTEDGPMLSTIPFLSRDSGQ